jgi:hypothetical protein
MGGLTRWEQGWMASGDKRLPNAGDTYNKVDDVQRGVGK